MRPGTVAIAVAVGVAVGAAALELAADCLVCETVQICQLLVAEQRQFDGSVLQDIALHVSRLLVSIL